ncbi:hypothetical protein ABIE20_005238 [Pseudomonas sp. 2835]
MQIAMRPVQSAHQLAPGLRPLRARSLARPAPTGPVHAVHIVGAGLAGDEAGTVSTSDVAGSRPLRARSLARPAPTGPAHAGLLWEPALPAMRPVQSAHQMWLDHDRFALDRWQGQLLQVRCMQSILWEPALPAMRPVQPAHQLAPGLRTLRARSLARPVPAGPVHAGLLWEPALPAMRPVQPAQ